MLILASCSSPDSTGNSNAPVDASSKTEISIPIEKFRTLNPIMSKDEDVYFMNKLIYDSLIDLDNNLVPVPELATSWTFENDGKMIIFTLNQDAKWHDGTPVTVNDVKFTIDALMRIKGTGQSLYDKNVANISSVSTLGQNQVLVKFRTSSNNALENFNFPIISKHQFVNTKNVYQIKEDFIPIGSGPYKYSKSAISNSILLTPNENYFKGVKAKNSLIFKIVPDKLSAINLFEIGDVMLTYSKAIDRATIFSDKPVNIFPYNSNEVEFVGFNFNNKYTSDKRIRTAIAKLTDTQKIINQAYFGNGARNDNIYFPSYLGKNSSDALIFTNFDDAKKLFAEVGYINRDTDPYLENSHGEEITINILVNAENKSRIAAAQIIKNSLDKLPIHSDIIVKDWNGYQSTINSGSYDIYIGGFKISELYDLRFALHSGVNNPVKYANPALDVYLDKMQSGITKEARLETFTNIKTIINQDLPYFCLLYKTHAAVTSKNFQGTINPYFYDIYHDSLDWKYIN